MTKPVQIGKVPTQPGAVQKTPNGVAIGKTKGQPSANVFVSSYGVANLGMEGKKLSKDAEQSKKPTEISLDAPVFVTSDGVAKLGKMGNEANENEINELLKTGIEQTPPIVFTQTPKM